MGYVAGIIQKDTSDVGQYLAVMGSALSHRTSGGHKAYSNKEGRKDESPKDLEIIKGKTGVVAGNLGKFSVHSLGQPMPGCDEKIVVALNGEIYNRDQIRQKLAPYHVFMTDNSAEVLAHLFEEDRMKNFALEDAIRHALDQIDGPYSGFIYDRENEEIIIARDALGEKPLFIAENNHYTAFASERKPLWNIGFTSTKPVQPGSALILSKYGSKKIEFSTRNQETVPINHEKIADDLRRKLLSAVKKRSIDSRKIAVLFSGGLDSSIITKILQIQEKPVELFCSAARGSADAKNARTAAKKFGLQLNLHNLTQEEVEVELPRIIYMIEETDPMKVAVAIPLYFAAREAGKKGFHYILSAQGADELFAGYIKHQRIYKNEGKKALQKALESAIGSIWYINLQSGDMATMAHTVNTRYPFLDKDLIAYAIRIDPDLKIKDDERKYILRKVADLLGMPIEIVERPKKATQYGSGANKLLKKMAKKHRTKNLKTYLKSLVKSLNTPESL